MSTILNAQDYKNIIGLVEMLPQSYTSTTKPGYRVLSRLLDCAREKKLPEFQNFPKEASDIQKLIEGKRDTSIAWDSLENDYSKFPELDLRNIQNDLARISYGYIVSLKEIKLLHKYFLKHKDFNLLEAIQNCYMNEDGESPRPEGRGFFFF